MAAKFWNKLDIEGYKRAVRPDVKLQAASERKVESILNREFKVFPYRFTDKAKESFYLELSTLFAAGLDIKTSLEILIGERSRKEERQLLQGMLDNLIKGDSFSASLQRTMQFSPYEYFGIQIGEESGKLSVVLYQLAAYFTNKLKLRRKIISALSYPVIILFTAFGAVAFMLTFVVPMFKDIFSRFGGKLPVLTRVIIGFSEGVQNYFLPGVILLVLFSALVVFCFRFETFKRVISRISLRIPILGRLVSIVYLERFCSSMSLLIGARVPLLQAIDLIGKMIPFYPIQDSLTETRKSVLFGKSLYESLARFPIYDKKMLALIKVGEEVNKLDFFFGQLSQRYNQDIEYQTSLLSTILEPLIIVFLGVVVAVILVAMYLPMFEMSTQIGL